jgi:hypothetical protein
MMDIDGVGEEFRRVGLLMLGHNKDEGGLVNVLHLLEGCNEA